MTAPYSSIAADIMCGLRRDLFSRYGVGVLKCFVDDSGSGDTKYFVMAGYLGTIDTWQQFDGRWGSVLDDSPRVPYFHAAEAESLRPDGVWAGISPTERDKKIDRLTSVIQSLDIQAIYVRMRQSDYNEIFKGKVPEQWDSPYYCLFSSFVALSGALLVHGFDAGGPIEFVFDTHEKYRKYGQEFYENSRILSPDQFAPNVHFRSDLDVPPLQAADLLAWQTRRAFQYPREDRPHFYEARKGGGRPHFAWTVSAELLWSWRNKFEDFAASVLNQLAKSQGVELTADVRPWKAKNPDPEHADAHDHWKRLLQAAKFINRGGTIEELLK